MPFIALKPTKFDREYLIGETIPDQVVDPSRAAALVGMKLIAAIAAAEPQASQEPAGDAGDAQGDANASTDNAQASQEPAGDAGDAQGDANASTDNAQASQEPAGDADGEGKADAPQTGENGAEGAQEPAAPTAEPSQEPEKKGKGKK